MEIDLSGLRAEKARLVGVLEEAKTARHAIADIDKVLTRFGTPKRGATAPNGNKPPCVVPDCTNPQKTRGVCSTHYHKAVTLGEKEFQQFLLPSQRGTRPKKVAAKKVAKVTKKVAKRPAGRRRG